MGEEVGSGVGGGAPVVGAEDGGVVAVYVGGGHFCWIALGGVVFGLVNVTM